jgi:hypothetical protein
MAIPSEYCAANNVPTALGVATDSAVARLLPAQLDTSAVAAVDGLGCGAEGKATVVVVFGAVEDVVVAATALDPCLCVLVVLWMTCTYNTPNTLSARVTKTIP